MSCFDVVYHQSTHHPGGGGGGGGGGYLSYQRSTPNSPLKKRCRLDPDLHQVGGLSSSAADGLYYDRGLLSFPGTLDTALKPDPLVSAATPSAGGHSSSRSSGAASSFSSALTSPSASSSTSPSTSLSSSSASSCAVASSTRTSSSTSSVVVALKCELMTSSSNGDDDDVAQQPVMTQPIGGNGLLLTYFSEDIDTNIDNHFHRALRLAQQQHGGHQRLMGRFSAAAASSVIAESKSQGSSSCCRQESSPLSQRSFPASFWNTVSCSTSSASSVCPSSSTSSSTSSSSYHPSNGSWSSLMVSPKADPLAAAFTVSPNPSDPYHLNAHFASAAAASPPGALGPLHQDPWNPYAFCPPPPPSQSGYRRYRHSIHEFSFSSDSPCSLSAAAAAAGGHFGSSGMRYKSLLNGSASSSSARDDPKSHAAVAADVWRSRCYGCADVTGSHIATGFTLSGDIEVTQTNLPDASVKDVYWF